MQISVHTLLCLWFLCKDTDARDTLNHYWLLETHQDEGWISGIYLRGIGYQAKMTPKREREIT